MPTAPWRWIPRPGAVKGSQEFHPDPPGQGLERDLPPLRFARALVRQDLAAWRDRTGGLSTCSLPGDPMALNDGQKGRETGTVEQGIHVVVKPVGPTCGSVNPHRFASMPGSAGDGGDQGPLVIRPGGLAGDGRPGKPQQTFRRGKRMENLPWLIAEVLSDATLTVPALAQDDEVVELSAAWGREDRFIARGTPPCRGDDFSAPIN